MDSFAPIQHTQIRAWLSGRKSPENLSTKPNQPWESRDADDSLQRRPSELAFATIALLNLPAILKFTLIKVQARVKAIRSWHDWSTKSFIGRWAAPTLERWDWRDSLIGAYSRALSTSETADWTQRLGLSRKAPLWTWISSGFVHHDVSHFLGNMMGLYAYASICTHIPGMSPLHVFVVTTGSSISASVAQLVEWHFRLPPLKGAFGDPRVGIGASGIVSAFAALAAAAAPWERLRIPALGISVPCCAFVAVQFCGDLAGLLRLDELFSKGPRKSLLLPRVGHAAHLGGALFGLTYYYVFLRKPGRDDSEVATERRAVKPNSQTPETSQ